MTSLLVSLLGISLTCVAGPYDYLKKFEPPIPWTRERAPGSPRPDLPVPRSSLSNFRQDFLDDGVLNVYAGLGHEGYSTTAPQQFKDIFQALSNQHQLGWTDLKIEADGRTVSFRTKDEIYVRFVIGNERDEFQQSFSEYEMIMYNGHSRYGRGPAFQSFSNYFRMGDVFPIIEVETNNRYFEDETILETDKFPLKQIDIGGKTYSYQYQGEQDHTSHLPATAYTKRIVGLDTDLRHTEYLNGRQIFFFHSCSNVNYWAKPLRKLFPDHDHKFVFGTLEETYGNYSALALVLTGLLRDLDSQAIVADLESLKNCTKQPCFTTY